MAILSASSIPKNKNVIPGVFNSLISEYFFSDSSVMRSFTVFEWVSPQLSLKDSSSAEQ